MEQFQQDQIQEPQEKENNETKSKKWLWFCIAGALGLLICLAIVQVVLVERAKALRQAEEQRILEEQRAREEKLRQFQAEMQQKISSLTPGQTAGERAVVNVSCVEFAFRWCPAGSFVMGSPKSEDGRKKNESQHEVTLTKGFWLQETEMTQKQWETIMGVNPSKFKGDDLPVENVSWDDCQDFCCKTGLQLPTEAQWEYACRAGSDTAYFWGDSLNGDKANCDGSYPCGTQVEGKSLDKTAPVRSYSPNLWGLYDMHGNVYEWCSDWWIKDYPGESVTDPAGPSEGVDRVSRGGAWGNSAKRCRSAYRSKSAPEIRSEHVGVRCLKLIDSPN